MWPAVRQRRVAVVTGVMVSGLLTMVLVWPGLGRGYLLYRDFVTVPDPVLGARAFGFDGSAPRAVPLDALTALFDPVVPSWLQQQVMLVAALWLSGAGVAVLLRNHGAAATAVGAALGTWSPYAVERLLLGQPPTLLAWSSLPWVVVAARSQKPTGRWLRGVVLASLPAALTPFGGLTAAGAALVVASTHGRSRRAKALLATCALGWNLPWLVPVLGGRTDAGQTDGATAFRVQAEGLAGIIDVAGGGGVWATGAQLASRVSVSALVASCILIGLAAAALPSLRRRERTLAAAALVLPPVVVLFLASTPGLAAFGSAQSIPGVAVFRDTHRLLLVSAGAIAALAPLGLLALTRHLRVGRRLVACAAGVVGIGLCLLSAPDAADRLHAAYRPVSYPASWTRVVEAAGDQHVLLLPWQPLRRVGWAGPQPFLDPFPLALRGEVTAARDLTVERDGRRLTVGSSDPSAAVDWRAGKVDADVLRSLGITCVIEWRGTPGTGLVNPDGLTEQFRTDEYVVWHAG